MAPPNPETFGMCCGGDSGAKEISVWATEGDLDNFSFLCVDAEVIFFGEGINDVRLFSDCGGGCSGAMVRRSSAWAAAPTKEPRI